MATSRKKTNTTHSAKRQTAKKTLTPKQKKFADHYIANGGNGAEAARIAYPDQTEEAARVTAARLLTNANILKRISESCDQATNLTANEVIGTLTAHLRSNITDVLPDDGGIISEIKAKNLGHLIKKIKVKRELKFGLEESQRVVEQVFEIVDIELYGSQGAAIQLSKILGLEQQARQNQNDATMRHKISKAIEILSIKHDMTEEETRALYLQINPEHEKWLN